MSWVSDLTTELEDAVRRIEATLLENNTANPGQRLSDWDVRECANALAIPIAQAILRHSDSFKRSGAAPGSRVVARHYPAMLMTGRSVADYMAAGHPVTDCGQWHD
jgi:hypothetical protein